MLKGPPEGLIAKHQSPGSLTVQWNNLPCYITHIIIVYWIQGKQKGNKQYYFIKIQDFKILQDLCM